MQRLRNRYIIPALPNGHVPEYANCHLYAFRAACAAKEWRELDESFFRNLVERSYRYGLRDERQ